MSRLYILFFLLPLAVSLPSPPRRIGGGSHKPNPDLIDKTCQSTLYYDICLQSLLSDPASRKANVKGLALIALKSANHYANDTSTYISRLMKIINDPFLKQCLDDCSDNYLDGIDRLDDSGAAMESKDYKDVNIWVSAAMSDSQSCEQGFKDKPGHKSLLTNRNVYLFKMCSNVLAITKLLE